MDDRHAGRRSERGTIPVVLLTAISAAVSFAVFVAGALATASLSPWDAMGYLAALSTIPGLIAMARPRWAVVSGGIFALVQVLVSLVALKVLDPTRAGWWPFLIFPWVLLIIPLVAASTVLGATIGFIRSRR